MERWRASGLQPERKRPQSHSRPYARHSLLMFRLPTFSDRLCQNMKKPQPVHRTIEWTSWGYSYERSIYPIGTDCLAIAVAKPRRFPLLRGIIPQNGTIVKPEAVFPPPRDNSKLSPAREKLHIDPSPYQPPSLLRTTQGTAWLHGRSFGSGICAPQL